MYLLKSRVNNEVQKKLFHSVDDICQYVKEKAIRSFSVKRLDIFEGFKPAWESKEVKLERRLVPLSQAADDKVEL